MQVPNGAPFPGPPGLETEASPRVAAPACAQADAAARAAAAQAAAANLEEKLKQLGLDAPDTQQFIEEIKAVIENHVTGKADELRAWGTQVMGQMNKRHKERTSELSEEVARCRERQARLEGENQQLKELLQHLMQRFQVLGAVIAGAKVPPDPLVPVATSLPAEPAAGTAAAGAATPSPGSQPGAAPVAGSPSQESPDTPPVGITAAAGPDQAAGTALEGSTLPQQKCLPELPPFPFPMQHAAAAAPLSLAEALGTQTNQHRTQLSLAASLSPTTAAPEVSGAARTGPGHFTFTLRKADGADLGLNVSHHEHDKALKIEGIRPEGAVEAWNRQCRGSMTADKVVMAGDMIISVNTISHDPVRMLEECRDKQLLKLTILRGDRTASTAANKAPQTQHAAQSFPFNAEASVFVPKGVEPPSSPKKDGAAAEAKGDGEVTPPKRNDSGDYAREAESTAASSVQASPVVPTKPEAASERV